MIQTLFMPDSTFELAVYGILLTEHGAPDLKSREAIRMLRGVIERSLRLYMSCIVGLLQIGTFTPVPDSGSARCGFDDKMVCSQAATFNNPFLVRYRVAN